MKKTISLVSAFLLYYCGIIYSQGVMDAYKYSQTDLSGTARSISMGGAMGAMGNDIGAISVNPAGIGNYQVANEIVTTINVNSMNNKTFMGDSSTDKNKTSFIFNNLAYTGSFNLNSDPVPFLNVGFSYNRIKNFDNRYVMQGNGYGPSISHLMADKANLYNPSTSSLTLVDNNHNSKINVWDNNPWLAVMGYNSGMIGKFNNGYAPSSAYYDNPQNKYLYNKETGGIDAYDLNIGTEIEKILSIGLSFSITDINYHLYSLYGEDFSSTGNLKDQDGYLDLTNYLKTEGTGYQVSLGLILKPTDFISLGVAYHSPTWYEMTDYTLANMEYLFPNMLNRKNINSYEGADAVFDYKLRTPDRFVFSLAGLINSGGRNVATISADYELTNYKGMKLSNRDNDNGDGFNLTNANIKDYFRMTSTVRVGAEIAFTPQFFGRLGYSWQQAAMKDDVLAKNIATTGSITQFVVDGDTNYFTWGLGYRFQNNFFTDIAFSYRNQTNELYSTNLADAVKLKSNSYQGLLTVGYRFTTF